MTMLEFWACYEVYCKKNGIKSDGINPDSLRDLMDKYGARSPSIKERTRGKT